MSFDFHLHSDYSDGKLAPAALVAHVHAHNVTQMALTDHDTLAGCGAAAAACAALGIAFVPGIELSVSWRGQSIHVIGLGLGLGLGQQSDTSAGATALHLHASDVVARRRARVGQIAARLQHRGRIDITAALDEMLRLPGVPTRMHVARALVGAGHAENVQDAFDRWLNHGRPGYAPVEWPDLVSSISVLNAAGGKAVLAHPHRYRLSAGALRGLLGEFKAAGGSAMEVSVGGMSRNDLDRLATLARRFGLRASAGSDFHDPAVPWNPPGRFAKLPADLECIAEQL